MTKATIGKPIYRDTDAEEFCVSAWNTNLIPNHINLLIESYTELGIGNMDQATFDDLITAGVEKARKEYTALVKKDLESFKTKAMRDTVFSKIGEYIEPIENSLRGLLQEFNSISREAPKPGISWPDIKIIDGKPCLDNDFIKRKFELRIESEAQAEVYELSLNVQNAYNSLKHFVSEKNKHLEKRALIDYRGLMFLKIDPDNGEISFIPQAIKLV
jgi:hypothetical protein